MKKSLVLIVFCCLLAVLGATAAVFSPPPASAPAAKETSKSVALTASEIQALIDQGKYQLQAHNILAARDSFAQAVSADPNHQEANLLYGITRVFAVVEQPGSGAGVDSVREIFEASGFSFQSFGLYGMEGTDPDGPAATTPRTGVVLDFVKLKVLTEIDGALNNLAKVTSPTFSSTIAPAALAQSYGSNIAIDYADALVVKALLNAVKCNLNLLLVYGLDVSVPQIAAAPDQLLTYKKLFADDATLLAVKSPQSLATARSALLAFIDTYTLAVPLLKGRGGAGHHLFVVDALASNEPVSVGSQDLDDVAAVLGEIKEALNGPKLLSFVQYTQDRDRTVDLSKFFNAAAPIDIRARLGNCSTGTMSSDATIGGLFPLGLSGYQNAVAQISGDLLGVVCTGWEKPKIQLTPDYLYLSEYQGYASGPQGVSIRNVGTGPLHTSSITLGGANGGDFVLKQGTCSSLTPLLAAGASCSVTVDVKRPVAASGFRSAALQVVSDDSSSPFSSAQISGWLDVTSGGSIAGLARDSLTGAGIWGLVSLYDAQSGQVLQTRGTNETGGYAFTGLGAGSYKLYFSPSYHPGETQYPTRWYNGKTSQAEATPVQLSAGQQLSDINFTLAPSPVTLSWGAVWRRTQADGASFDVLDAGINSSATSLAGLTLKVDGPNGFSYSFAEADKVPYLNGRFSLFKSYPSGTLAAGVYTFTLTDANGNKSYRLATRPAAPSPLPKVDSATIKYQRKADGSYRFSWAPVSASKSYHYRLRIARNDSVGAPVYFSSRSMAAVADLPPSATSPLLDGTAYKVRVEVLDAPTADLQTSRSESAFVEFTPQPGQYNPSRLIINSAVLYNRTDSNGAVSTDANLSVNTPSAITSVDLRDAAGSVIYTFQAADRSNQDYYKKFAPALAPGSYTLHFVANGLEHFAPVTLSAPVSYPIPNAATMQAEDLGNDNIRFSWANVNVTGPVYYRISLFDTVTGPAANGPSFTSARNNVNYVDVPKAALGDLATKQWRVEVMDSDHVTTQRNRVNGAYINLVPTPFNASRPLINSWRLRGMTSPAGVTRSQLLVNAAAPGGVLSEIRVTGPNGYSRDLLSQGSFLPAYNAYLLEEPGAPAAGLYTITAKSGSGLSATRYLYQPASHVVPAVDFRTLRSHLEPNGDLRISWAPVASDLPVWYQVSLYDSADGNGDHLMDPALFTANVSLDVNYDGAPDQVSVYPYASVVVPASFPLPASAMIRVTALDGGQSAVKVGSTVQTVTNVVHNASQSAMVKAVRGLFNYGTLTDSDGDGYASNIDPNDGDASVYPFSSGTSLKTLTVQNGGSGSGSVTSSPTGIACLTGTSSGCSASFTGGSQVSLTTTVSNGSVFAGWSGACSGTGSCLVTMDAAKTVTASFDLKPATVRIDGKSTYYYSLGLALDQASSGETVRARNLTFVEDLLLDSPVALLLKGGFTDGLFSLRGADSFTVLDGSLRIRQGTLRPERLILR